MVLLVGVGTGYSFEISASMAVYAAGMGIVLPQANASAIMPFPERAGAASSLQGLTQMSFAAIVGALLVPWLKSSALPLAVTVAIMGVMTVLAIQEIKRQKAMSVPAPLPSPAE
jgi:DHA1 family bicyclomycin/chloramphenicol resistance-like MFS transporter